MCPGPGAPGSPAATLPGLLILFDIDGTLLRTQGAGMRALELAGREAIGPRFSAAGIDFAGAIDPVIIARMLERAGVEPTSEAVASVRRRYPPHLARELARGPRLEVGAVQAGSCLPQAAAGVTPYGALPGVHALLRRLGSERPGITTGLLTGNFEEGARLKLAHCGIEHDTFLVRVYGDDSPHPDPCRDHLPPVALERFERRTGRSIQPRRVLVIGDTTHDVGCARAHGLRSLGVATGGHTRDRLQAAGADRVLDTLEDTDDLLKWFDQLAEQ